jgi:hypothetical protein
MSQAGKRIVVIAIIVVASLGLVVGATAAQRGSPAMTCAFSPGDGVMRVTVKDWGENSYFWITRHGNRLIPRKVTYPHKAHAISCTGGTPTVHDVDRIEVRETNRPGSDGIPSASQFELDMSHGRFGPGATPETDGRSEIETLLDLPGAQVVVRAPPHRHRLAFGVEHSHFALNAEGGSDLDVEFAKTWSVELRAGAGANVIDARTGPAAIEPRRPVLFGYGNSGDDRLIGGGRRDQLYGGRGTDWLTGVGGAGLLNGGSGPDRLIAGPQGTLLQGKDGNDLIEARNGHRDWIGCGPGDDRARVDHHEENMSGCEHARPVKTRF